MKLNVCLAIALPALLALAAPGADEPDSWQAAAVPGATSSSGFAWYRCWVKVPESYFTAHERNLFEESVGIYIRGLAGAHEVWVNGRNVGIGGAFPPNFKSGGEGIHRHKVPAGTLQKGAWNEIAIRVYNPSGRGGFLGDAPFIMDYFMECVFEGPWQVRLGDSYKPGPAVTNRPAVATFDHFRESSRVLGRGKPVPGPKLSPVESAAKMRPADGFAVDLLLSEPLVAQPTHFSFDERGRLWVAQYRQYPYPAGLTMLSRDKYYRAHYDKIPPAPPNHDRGADIISIHEDTNGDGMFDRHKVFVDGLNMANAVVRGRGGVWIMQTPYLLFYPDRDGDDIADGAPEVCLAGFGLEDTHSVANGLAWGPDGWLYGAQGSTTSCRVTRPGLDPTNAPGVYFEGCMVWRYHPDTRALEIFAEGSGNTFGLEFDAQGRLHSGHNGGDTRGWHYVQGGFYQMQGVDPGKFGPPRNPYAFGELPMMRTMNKAVRFTHFGAFAEGTAMPPGAAGLLFSLDPLHNVVLTSERLPRGATFETLDREPALRSDDETFRPLYIANAPDGSLFVSDMCEFYIAHGQHYQNQIDPTSGRIYRLRGAQGKLETNVNLAEKATDELTALLSHGNKWHRHTAARLLGERKDREATMQLRQMIERDEGHGALNALWALYQLTRFEGEDETVKKALKHRYAPVRMWTVRLLGDEYGLHRGLGAGTYGRASDGVLWTPLYEPLTALARTETDREVLAQMASTARRLNVAQAMDLVAIVMAHEGMEKDPFIPQLCWWVFEAHIPPHKGENNDVMALFHRPEIWKVPLVFEYILPRLARRYAVEGKRAELLLCAELFRLAPSGKHAAQLMQGLEEAFRGRSIAGLPDELLTAIAKSGQAPLAFRVKVRETTALGEALETLRNVKATEEERLLLARTLGEVREPRAIPVLLTIASNPGSDALRTAALASLSAYDDESIGVNVLKFLPGLSGELRIAAFSMMASRVPWAVRLLEAMQGGKFKAEDIPEDVANRLRASKDGVLRELAAQVLPSPEPVVADHQKRIDEINDILKRAPGNPYKGETAYMQRCAACHRLFFKGGVVGPDLTAYQRDNLGTMLLSIVNPSAEIREGFQYYSVETKDGRTLSGFFIERDNQITVLRGLDGENVALPSSQIVNLQPMGRSLMPDGLLDDMAEQELRDLFAYLRISQPITK